MEDGKENENFIIFKMKVLVTGGAGFIGTNYVKYHLEKRPADELVVLDALTYSGHKENLAGLNIMFVEGRIEDKKLVNELFEKEKFDWVVHFAAESHVDRSIKNPEIFVTTNVLGTQVLLDAARNFGLKRFHHVSTDEIYGDLGLNSTNKFTEESAIAPSSPYSASKAASDMICLAYLRTFGLAVTISRCSNNYGPYQSVENFIPRMINLASNGENLQIYGTGENIRDWLFVKDHCEAILKILENGKIGEIYNIGGGSEIKNIDVAKMILKTLGKSVDLIEFVQDRKGHDERYAIDFNKIKSELGWTPRGVFADGLRQTIEWYKLNSYERNHISGRNGHEALPSHESNKQTSTAGL